MAPPNKLSNHERLDEITRWLLDGVSVREVESRLNQIYNSPETLHLRVAASTLQNFRKEHLQIQDKVLDDIKAISSITKDTVKREVLKAEVEQTNAYKEKLSQIVDEKLDATKEFTKILTIMESRIEKLYNKISETEFVDGRQESLLIRWMEQIQGALEKYSKHVSGGYSNETNVNISVAVANDQIVQIREAVRETLAEVDPGLSVVFMEKLHTRLNQLTYKESDANGFLMEPKS